MTDTPTRSTDLVQPHARLTVDTGQSWWTDAQRAALASAGLDTTPDGDLVAFLHLCQRTGLDPFAREIYLIGRKDRNAEGGKKWTAQTGIDGYRHIAERTGEFVATLGPWWCGPDGQWTDVWLSEEPPAAARVGIVRKDHPEPYYGVAVYREFVPMKKVYVGSYGNSTVKVDENGKDVEEPQGLWGKMPAHMLAKCAEALAIRRAFPRQSSGIYLEEEMQQVDVHTAAQEAQQVAAAREQSRADYVRRPWDNGSGQEPASPADTAPGDVVPSEVVEDAEVLPSAEELQAELAEQAEILGSTPAALAARAVALHRRNVEDFTAEQLLPIVESLRGQVREALPAHLAAKVAETAQSTEIPEDGIPVEDPPAEDRPDPEVVRERARQRAAEERATKAALSRVRGTAKPDA